MEKALRRLWEEEKLKDAVKDLMRERGITTAGIGELVYELQQKYHNGLTRDLCEQAVERVLEKRDVQHAILTGLCLDILTERGAVQEPLRGIIAKDESLYGMDEVLGMSITNIYGTIGVTGFGYLDKTKVGLVGELDGDKKQVNTFADDLVAALAAAAAAKLAHGQK